VPKAEIRPQMMGPVASAEWLILRVLQNGYTQVFFAASRKIAGTFWIN
jgi:hypothetical protein